jgi:hypothetical protein
MLILSIMHLAKAELDIQLLTISPLVKTNGNGIPMYFIQIFSLMPIRLLGTANDRSFITGEITSSHQAVTCDSYLVFPSTSYFINGMIGSRGASCF